MNNYYLLARKENSHSFIKKHLDRPSNGLQAKLLGVQKSQVKPCLKNEMKP